MRRARWRFAAHAPADPRRRRQRSRVAALPCDASSRSTCTLQDLVLPAVAMSESACCLAVAPRLAARLSQPPSRRPPAQWSVAAARDGACATRPCTGAFFDRFVTAETHWLAPDNFQSDPEPVVAMRTSPTNIGLQLLATVSACDLGLITVADMTRRLEQTFATLSRAAAVSRSFLQLVRPARPARAGTAVYQHGRQRQHRRPPDCAATGMPASSRHAMTTSAAA